MQGYEGAADWNIIRAVEQAVRIPVIGNGDIRVPADARRCRETGCDAVMIGRAAASNPWIFRQIEQFAASGRYDEPTEVDRYRLLSTYFRHLIDAALPDAIGKMKQFACFSRTACATEPNYAARCTPLAPPRKCWIGWMSFSRVSATTSKPALLPSPQWRRLSSKPSLAA